VQKKKKKNQHARHMILLTSRSSGFVQV
jgi:hypothetical protein